MVGLVDWEFSHLGDPLDDIAWVRSRSRGSRFAGLVDVELPRYEQMTGSVIDPGRLAYYDVLVITRLAITTGMAIHKGGGAMGFAGYLFTHQAAVQRLGSSILAAMGASPHQAPTRAAPQRSPVTGYFDHPLGPQPVRPPGADGQGGEDELLSLADEGGRTDNEALLRYLSR